ncbi:hypothetical protein JK164_12105 [Gluconobacter kondonii]|uniref:hypothetical protein n=1 Tax=Gluconobacter kondonii TaxID=941463 RepID=UPI001B8D5E45|nr:hypothetical protein [Gluconobacter kondonii]MBS1066679.1 hypothetical protein [Gluconobacter kondonii]
MAISQGRFELSLENLKPSDWERFEKLSSTFLASEWPHMRTMAAPDGDGGRDSELFSPIDAAHVAIQYSVTKKWKPKINATITRLKHTFPDTNILVYLSNQTIGAAADTLKNEAAQHGIFLDVRDRTWFVERLDTDDSRRNAATELARVIVDPLYAEATGLGQAFGPLSRQEQGAAFFFLEMQWHDNDAGKGLTKSSFESLVRAALNGTDGNNRLHRSVVHERIGNYLPQHSADSLRQFIDGALTRLTKTAVRHHKKTDEFNISHEESEKLKNSASIVELLRQGFVDDLRDLLSINDIITPEYRELTVESITKMVKKYLMQKGEGFAASLAHDAPLFRHAEDFKSLAIEFSPKTKISQKKTNPEALMYVLSNILSTPGEKTTKYLSLLSNTCTIFAFLQETPDVQKITKKLFLHGAIWIDTSAILPIFSEQSIPEEERYFTNLFKQAKVGGMKLYVTIGIIEEIERHLNRCIAYSRAQNWNGSIPYVYAMYALNGNTKEGFQLWVERFLGPNHPMEDITEYLFEEFGIIVEKASDDGVDSGVRQSVQDYWQKVHDSRRGTEEGFNLYTTRLAQHDAENCLNVLSERRRDLGKSPLGYTSWWLTLDKAAREMDRHLSAESWKLIRHSPVLSLDFLLKYLAFGPNRDRVGSVDRSVLVIFDIPLLQSIPQDLINVAQKVRSEYGQLPERQVQRRIRDAIDREKMMRGNVEKAGLDQVIGTIKEEFG